MSKRKLFNQLSSFDKGLEKTPEVVNGLLGVIIDGEQVVEVPTRNGFFFVRLRDNSDELIQAFNDKVAPVYDLPVLLTYRSGRYVILGRDIDRYGDWGSSSSYLPKHGATHSFVDSGPGGGDVSFIYPRQIMPWLTQPSGTKGANNVLVNAGLYLRADGTWRYDSKTGTADLLSYKPTGSTAVMVLIYEDMDAGVLGYSVGSPFSANLTGTADIAPYLPTLADSSLTPLAAVRLVSGTSSIKWNSIYDARQWVGSRGGGSSTGTTFNIYDEGVLQGTVTEFDFVGPNVDASVSGTRARIFITGSTGGGGNLTIEDVTSQIDGTVTHFNLVGTIDTDTESLYYNGLRQRRTDHYTVDMDGGGFTTIFTGTVGDNLIIEYGNVSVVAGGGGLVIQDEGVFVATGTVLNFVGDGVTAALNGSVVDVTIPGGGGGGRTLITGAYPSGIDTVSLTSIPQSYKQIEIEMMARTTANGTPAIYLNINDDATASHYYHQEFYGYSSYQLVPNDDNFSNTFGYVAGNNCPTGSYGWLRVVFPLYDKGTFFKIGQWHFAVDGNTSGGDTLNMFQGQGATVWKNKNPMTSIAVKSSSGNYMTGTVINFYGVS